MAYTVFESTNMACVKYGERIYDCVCDETIENGTIGYIEELEDAGGVIYTFNKGYKEKATIVVANNPAWNFNNDRLTDQRRDKFNIEAGTPFRGFTLKIRDEYGITIEGFTSATRNTVATVTDFNTTPVYVTIDNATGKLAASTTKNTSAKVLGRIMRKRIIGGTLSTPIRTYGYANAMYEIRFEAVA